MNINSNGSQPRSSNNNGVFEQFISKKKWVFFSLISVVAICILFISHPRSFVIADEISYYSASKALSQSSSFVIDTSNIFSSKYPFDLFVESPAGIVSKYPPGWFSFASLFFRLLPNNWVLFLNILIGILMVFLVFYIGWKLMGDLEGLIAASIIIVCPPIMFYSNTFMSDIFSTFLIVIVFFLVLYTFKTDLIDITKFGAAGLIAGYSVTARYSNIYIIPVFLCYLICRKPRKSFKNIYAFILGLIPPGIMLYVFQRHFFGSGFRTGYSHSSGPENFVLTGAIIKFINYLQSLFVSGLPVFALLGLIGMVLFIFKEKQKGLLLSGLIIAPIIFYSFYYWHTSDTGGHLMILRFILPAMPFLALSGAYAAGMLMRSGKSYVRWISILIVFVLFINSGLKTWHSLQERYNVDTLLIQNTHRLLPPNAVVICGYINHPSLLWLGDKPITVIELKLLDNPTENAGGSRINQRLMQQNIPGVKGAGYDFEKAYSQARSIVNSALADRNLYAALNTADLENLTKILDAGQTIVKYDEPNQWIIVQLFPGKIEHVQESCKFLLTSSRYNL